MYHIHCWNYYQRCHWWFQLRGLYGTACCVTRVLYEVAKFEYAYWCEHSSIIYFQNTLFQHCCIQGERRFIQMSLFFCTASVKANKLDPKKGKNLNFYLSVFVWSPRVKEYNNSYTVVEGIIIMLIKTIQLLTQLWSILVIHTAYLQRHALL